MPLTKEDTIPAPSVKPAPPSLSKVINTALHGASVAERTRALFALKADGSTLAREGLEKSMENDPSVLVQHEAAYLLGQLGSSDALPRLSHVVEDTAQHPMVRHEAAEALGAIGDERALPLLQRYAAGSEAPVEVSQTCRIAVQRVEWIAGGGAPDKFSPYTSTDPAPALKDAAAAPEALGKVLCDPQRPIYERYRAMFALRNIGGADSVRPLCEALLAGAGDKQGALLRHEVAYVLGQMQDPASCDALAESLANLTESEMVRHEAAEALGSIGTPQANKILQDFRKDQSRIVRESIGVALDIADYVNSDALHYAPPKETTA